MGRHELSLHGDHSLPPHLMPVRCRPTNREMYPFELKKGGDNEFKRARCATAIGAPYATMAADRDLDSTGGASALFGRLFGKKKEEKTEDDLKLEQSLQKTRSGILGRLGSIFQENEITDALWEELEDILVAGDVGIVDYRRVAHCDP